MSDRYTHGHHDSVLRSHRWRTVDNSASYLLEHLRPGTSLLDVGCGPGTLTADLAKRVAPGRVIGLDREQAILREAREATADLDNVVIQEGDAYSLPFPDGSFDVVHAHQVLQHVTDPIAALAEMRRVCTPTGVVAARDVDYGAMTWWPPEPSLDQWRATYSALARSNGAEPDAGRRLKAWARQAEFEEIIASASVWCFSTAQEREWWAGLWAERVTESDVAKQALSMGIATARDLEKASQGWQRWGQSEDGWFAVIHGEVLCKPVQG